MNLQQLYYFLSVVDLEHITKASQVQNTSQSTISTAIKNLEEELGVSLINKSGRGIEITEYGLIFEKYIRESLNLLEKGVRKVQTLKKQEQTSVKIATTFSLGSSTLPFILSSFYKANNDLNLKICQGANNQIVDLLLDKKIDLILSRVTQALVENENLLYHPLFIEDIYLILPRNHRLSKLENIEMEDLKNEPIITFDESTGFKQEIIDICLKHGFTPNIAFEAIDNSTVTALVQEGLGISFVAQTGPIDKNKIKITNIKNEPFQSTTCIAWNSTSGISKELNLLINFVKNLYPKPIHNK